MGRPEKFTYRKRLFLAHITTGFTSYILAEVESSKDGEYKYGHYMLTLADCSRRIQLEFPLMTARDRRNSLAKIDRLIEVLVEFGLALQKEAAAIAGSGETTTNRSKKDS